METKIKSYRVKEHRQPVERYCRTLDLRDDPKWESLKWRYTSWARGCS